MLGNSAFDPRRFAAAWAGARGVTGPPPPDRQSFWRLPVAIALAVLLGVLTLGAGLVLVVGRASSSIAFATRRIVAGPGPLRMFVPGGRIAVPGPRGLPFVGTQITGVGVHPIALVLLFVGVVGLGVLAVLYWSRRSGPRRYRRHEGRRTPSWN